jgi:hypothetical protein
MAAVALLPGCSSLAWLKTRFVEPKEETVAAAPAPTPAPVAARAAAPAAAPAVVAPAAPAVPAAPSAPPPAATRPAVPVAEAPRATAPTRAAPPAAAPAAASPAAGAASSSGQALKAAGDLAPGRFAVQVAVFMTGAFAETRRTRLVEQLLANAMPEADATRVVARDDRYFVLVGDLADRSQAEALAARLRSALRQDVAIFRR